MKVIYKICALTLKEKIEAEIKRAKDSGTPIECIELTKEEWEELSGGGALPGDKCGGYIHGVKVSFNGYHE